eukprot:TRINITY_DN27450_c0_g1_i1.p1 TRINITY_DN27450_c0_g1~~TRINITY_DN27450_c0_g1_i1.p1  ORF type:complete len:182 (-),score=68.99 TRINITY_DN27450_c0_g1_i1:79-624(-)
MALPVIWIIGGPGSGKGTQCDQIVGKYGFNHLSSGDLLRGEVLAGTPRGIQLFRVMEQGLLVPDEEVVGLLKDAMAAKSGNTKGFVIDGFPVTMDQAKLFEDMIGAPTKIVVFEVNDEVMKIRLKERSNFDDKPESILKRIETFTSQTRPVIKQYAKAVISINADRAPDVVFADVAKAMEA